MQTIHLVLVSQSEDCQGELEEILLQQDYEPLITRVGTEDELAGCIERKQCDIVVAEWQHAELPAKVVFNATLPLHHQCLFLALFPDLDERAILESVRMGADGFLLQSRLKAIVPALKSHYSKAKSPIQKFLRNSEQVFQALLEESTDSIWAKHRDGRYLLINPAGARFLGKPVEDILGKDDSTLFAPETVKKIRASDHIVMERGQTQTIEDLLTPADGVPRTFQAVKGVFRNDAGGVEGVIGIVRDVSDRKNAEDALRDAKNEAEQAALHKSEFLATMSHEIRTPMNAVLGVANLLAETPLNAEQRELVDTLLTSGKSLLSIINDILDYSKLEAGKIQLKSETVCLEECLRLVTNLFRHLIQNKDLQILYHIAPNVPKAILADPDWLRQIFLNLVGNAMRYTESGFVVVRVSVLEAERNRNSEEIMLQFEVQDTGPGIPGDKLQSIFESFTQVTPALSRTSGGTGLGLAICQKLVHLMGGRIWVESALGRGSTFFFTIRTRADVSAPVVLPAIGIDNNLIPENELASRIPIRILVAEDNPTNRFLLKRQFDRLGYEPIFAENGVEAIEKLTGQPFDLVFMDVQMPRLNGIETTLQIRGSQNAYQNVCIIAMTAFASNEDERTCLLAGMNDFLAKPVAVEDIQRMIIKWFGLKAANPQPVASNLPAVGEDTKSSFNLEMLGHRTGNNPTVKKELVALFLNDCRRLVNRLQAAYEKKNSEELAKSAHELKGACMYLGAKQLKELASDLEVNGKRKTWKNVPKTLQALKAEALTVEELLSQLPATDHTSTDAHSTPDDYSTSEIGVF